ncbi:MAG: heme o synthase [Nitrososphaerales archaeon]
MKPAYNYFEVTKPKIWLLLVFTAVGGLVVASGRDIPWIIAGITLAAVTLGSAGSNTLTNYLDRDIDAVMNRTRLRPLPTRRIHPASRALYFGLALSLFSLVLAASINLLSFILMFLGIFDNVVIYSRFLKRRSPANIILGGFSGGMPVLIGYAAVKNEIGVIALFMAALVMVWIPTHIWSLALHSKEDYSKVNVPMLPVIVSEKTAVRVIAITSILMVLFSLLAPLYSPLGPIYIYSALVLGIIILVLSVWLFIKPTKEISWIVFKASSPYLGFIFLALIIDTLL